MIHPTTSQPSYDLFYNVERLPDDYDDEHSAINLKRWRMEFEADLNRRFPGMYLFPGKAYWVKGMREGITIIWKEYDAVPNKH